MALRFADRVVVVTGAGGGLGREYALEFARRGASVVVNDLGGSRHGDGLDKNAADIVVKEIQSFGGNAVANYNSVEEGDKVIKTALDNYGRLDILVNNAGIIRDRSFMKMTENDWDLVHKVHLKGSFLLTKAAWPHFRQQKFGRIIMTASGAGLYGNFGQANYSAAKLGLLGLSNTLAVEGISNNIHCNTIVPVAASRLTEGVIPADVLESLKPKYITPLVVYLSHDSCEENGSVFELAAGWIGKLRWQRSDGAFLRHELNGDVTAEQVKDSWHQITDFTHSHYPTSLQESLEHIMAVATSPASTSFNSNNSALASNLSPSTSPATSQKSESSSQFSYTERDAIIYALGVGASTAHPGNLKYLYERSPDFTVLPTFAVLPSISAIPSAMASVYQIKFDPIKTVHGEHYIEIFKPLSRSGTWTTQAEVVDVLDKGNMSSFIINITITDDNGEKIAFNQVNVIALESGNFGGKRTSDRSYPVAKTPNTPPDATVTETVNIDQAAMYRLAGDLNPLHIDPEIAKLVGFSKPILHGLCSLGFATRAVLSKFCNDDPSQITSIKVRFSHPVYPGQTLQTNMWKDGTRVLFACKVLETGKVCLSGGYVQLAGKTVDILPEQKGPILESDSVFEQLRMRVSTSPDIVNKIKAVFTWNITVDGKTAVQWTTDLKNGHGSVTRGEHSHPDCSLTVSDSDLVAMATGSLNPQQAFMKGKLKLSGNILLAQKLGHIFKDNAKL